MIKKILFAVLLILSFQAKSQNTDESMEIEDHSISAQLYTKCYENLNQGTEIIEQNPKWKDSKPCSLLYCMMLLGLEDKEATNWQRSINRNHDTTLSRRKFCYIDYGNGKFSRSRKEK
ncbi:hypothetical protein FLA105534_04637 [Flavobacterium bizetiae]|uniref:Uncharacterized protein n=1 Tax=Flavobacterium bizetiae TaxID=2704140 RepID=A0A6J4GX12_9FLAO|nr:hypothetical protein FLA105534_04637 [Flavobacterium bizetiae]CAD5344846.1 hypothetical protein FLA105535_04858 [Flavobacterium bizetiae]CAD5350854.1 hypothetical protein FLA105534_04849 [Flavobacterium bizetiae]